MSCMPSGCWTCTWQGCVRRWRTTPPTPNTSRRCAASAFALARESSEMRELWSRFGLRTRLRVTHLLVALLPAALFLSLTLILLGVLAPSTLAVAPLSGGQMVTILLIAAIAGLAGAGIAVAASNRLFGQVVGPIRRASAIAG